MKDLNDFEKIASQEGGLHRQLSGAQITMIAVGGAIGTGLFMGSAVAIGFGGPSVILSFSLSACISLMFMGCLAEMTVAHPTTGSFGAYAEHYLNPWAGFVVRYSYWLGLVFAIGAEITAIGIYMQFWFPQTPGWVWIGIFTTLLVLVNSLNVKIFGTTEYWFAMIKVIAIVMFIIIGAFIIVLAPADGPIGFKNYFDHGGFFPNGISGTWIATIVAMYSFFGIEMVAVAAGEAQDPTKAISSAFKSSIGRLIIFYIGTLAIMLALIPWTDAGIAKSPFVQAMEVVHIPAAAGIINFVVLIAALSAMNSQLYITSRMMFSLARAGHAPKIFGNLSAQGTPVNAMAVSFAGILFAMVLSLVSKDSFVLMIAIAMFGPLFTWFMTFVTHFFFRRQWEKEKRQPLSFRMWGFPWLTILGGLCVGAVMISTFYVQEFHAALITGIPFIAVLSFFFWLKQRKKS